MVIRLEKPPLPPKPVDLPTEDDLSDEQYRKLLDDVTEESGLPRAGEKLKVDVDSEKQYRIGTVVRYRGQYYYIASVPYTFDHREFIDVVCTLKDLDDSEKRKRVPLIEVVLSRKRLVNTDRMAYKHATNPDRHGLPVMTGEDIRYSKMTPERQRQIAEDHEFAEYVYKYPHDAEIFYETIPCKVALSPYKDKDGKILVKIKSDDGESAGFRTKVVPVEDIILRSEVVGY